MIPFAAINRKPSALIAETQRAYEAELFMASLGLALTIPDVCSSFESEDSLNVGRRYR